MNIKDVKVSFLKNNKYTAYSLEFDAKARCMYGPGVYIFYSPSSNTAYIGQSIDIFDRLKKHIRNTFVEGAYIDSNSYKVLELDDVEMYCCFTEDVYDYNNVEDISKELKILESYTMEVFLNAGINLFNHIFTDYNLEDLQSPSFYKVGKSIDLEYDFFRFGLKERLIDTYCYSDLARKNEIRSLKKERDTAICISERVMKDNNKLKETIDTLKEDLKCSQRIIDSETIVNKEDKNLYLNEENKDVKTVLAVELKKWTRLSKEDFENLELKEFIGLLKECSCYKDVVDLSVNISNYINSLNALSFDITSAVIRLVRRRSEFIIWYLFKYKTTIKESTKKEILNELCEKLISDSNEFYHKFME